MNRHAWAALLVAAAILASSCDDGGGRSRGRRSRRDDDNDRGRRAERTETPAPDRPAPENGTAQAPRTTGGQAAAPRPAEQPPAPERAVVPAEVVGTWGYEQGDEALWLTMRADGTWTLDSEVWFFIEVYEGRSSGTYRIAGTRIQFTVTDADDGEEPEYATMPSPGRLLLKVEGVGTKALTRRRDTGRTAGREEAAPARPERPTPVNPQALLGTWAHDAGGARVRLTIQPGGHFTVEIMTGTLLAPARSNGTYTLEGDRLTLRYAGGIMPDDISTISMPEPNLLVFTGLTGIRREYRRAQ